MEFSAEERLQIVEVMLVTSDDVLGSMRAMTDNMQTEVIHPIANIKL